MRNFFTILFVIIQVYVGVKFNFGIFEIAILCFNCVGTVVFWRKHHLIKESLFQITVFCAIFFSTFFFSAFPIFPEKYKPTADAALSFAQFGNQCLAIFFCSLLLIRIIFPSLDKRNNVETETPGYRPISNSTVWIVIIFMYGLTLFSASIGLGVMGQEAVQLPFGIGGIIVGLRREIAPILFMLYIHNSLSTRKNRSRFLLLAIVLWAILETIVLMSKSSLIYFFLPTFILLFYTNLVSKKKLARITLPAILLFVIGYTTIENLRSMDSVTISGVSDAYKMGNQSDEKVEGRIINRVFTTPVNFVVIYDFIRNEPTFYFNRFPIVASAGGSAKYRTYVIESYSSDAHHSSGTSWLTDPYLLGGKGFVFVTIFLVTLFVMLSDRRSPTMYKPMLYSICLIISMFINWSLLFDGEIAYHIGIWALEWWLIYIYEKKCVIIPRDYLISKE